MSKTKRFNRAALYPNYYRILKLKEIFPEIFTEGKLDFDKFRTVLGDLADDNPEPYLFTWAGKKEAQASLLSPSEATLIPCPEESVDFDNGKHIFIEGENLETLKLLLKPYYERVKMIYIDPPYNKGKDFVYCDNFREPLKTYLEMTGQIDHDGNPQTLHLETSGRFHSRWLSMMYPRLCLARDLLREDGAIFISIDENEIHNLRMLLNEIFGEENFVNILHVKRAAKNVNQQFNKLKRLNLGIEYVLVYRKSQAFIWKNPYKEASQRRKQGYWTSFYNNADRPTMRYELLGVKITKGQWKWKYERAMRAVKNYQTFINKYPVKEESEELKLLKKYWEETGREKEFIKLRRGRPHYWVKPSNVQLRTTDWTDIYINDNRGKERYGFDTVKSVKAIQAFISSVAGDDCDIILDFFAGSGTTGEAIMNLNQRDGCDRRFICIQLPEKLKKSPVQYGTTKHKRISDICKERLAAFAEKMGIGLKVFKLGQSNFKVGEEVVSGDAPRTGQQ